MVYNSLFLIPETVVLCSKYWGFFGKLWLILSQLELSRTDLSDCTPNILMENCRHVICPVLSILFMWLGQYGLAFENFFKITCFLASQVISLEKNGGAISKIYCVISCSPICTPLILVSASVKMAGSSAIAIYGSMKVYTPGKLLI